MYQIEPEIEIIEEEKTTKTYNFFRKDHHVSVFIFIRMLFLEIHIFNTFDFNYKADRYWEKEKNIIEINRIGYFSRGQDGFFRRFKNIEISIPKKDEGE